MVLRLLVSLLHLIFWFLLGLIFWWVAGTFRSIPDVPIRHLDLILPEAKTQEAEAAEEEAPRQAASQVDALKRSPCSIAMFARIIKHHEAAS
jgi:hypothetical protein